MLCSPADKARLVYQQMKDAALSAHPAISIKIFVSPDVDSVCTLIYMTELLKADYLTHEVCPVLTYQDILANIISDEIKTLVFINCGATVDLPSLLAEHWSQQDAAAHVRLEDLRILVFDSHRPVHLSNLYTNLSLYVFMDNESIRNLSFEIPSLEEYTYHSSTSDDSEYDHSDGQTDDDGHGVKSSLDSQVKLNGVGDDAFPATRGAQSRHQRNKARRTKRRAIDERQTAYYAKSSHGLTSSWAAYNFYKQIMRPAKKHLWYLIVSLTYQYLYNLLGKEAYIQRYRVLLQEVESQFNPENTPSATSVSAAKKRRTSSAAGDIDTRAEIGLRIYRDIDFQIMGLHHASLYEGLIHSDYVAARHWTWKKKGKDTISEFLTVMGFSQRECKELYSHMNLDLKRNLRSRMQKHCASFNLPDILYDSFSIKTNMRQPSTAADYVYSLAGTLQDVLATSSSEDTAVAMNGVESKGKEAAEKAFLMLVGQERAKNLFQRNFFAAADLLKNDEIEQGLYKCIQHQRIIYEEARLMFTGRRLARTGSFRMGHTVTHHPILASPLNLIRLAHFICETYRHSTSANYPLVLVSKHPVSGHYTVCGVFGHTGPDRHHAGDDSGTDADLAPQSNLFSVLFEAAAKAVGAELSLDQFHSNAIVISESDLDPFLNVLLDDDTG